MRLRFGGQEVRLVGWPPRSTGSPWVPDAGVIEAELRSLIAQDGGAERLEELLSEARGPGRGRGRRGGDVIARAMRALGEGRLVLVPAEWRVRPKRASSVADLKETAEGPPAAPRTPPAKTWVVFKVVDEKTGDPVSSVRLKVTLPDGIEDYYTTSGSGTVRIDELRPGTCDVSCDLTGANLDDTYEFKGDGEPTPEKDAWPSARINQSNLKRIGLVERHKVKDGDSILSIAKSAGLDWKFLARFNWKTDVPDEINQRLVDDVGVTKRTKDGKNWQFTSQDHPGIVYVPKRWEKLALATGQEHVLKVRLVAPLFLRLRTQEGEHRVPEAGYTVIWANQQEHEGKVGKAGIDLVEDPPPGAFQVEWKEHPQVLAGSLAAHARHAMDGGDQRTLLEVLKFDKETTELLIAAYDAHFNDYSGRGFIEDVYGKFPDEEERGVLEIALLRSGIKVKSGAELVSLGDTPHPEDVDEEFEKVGAAESVDLSASSEATPDSEGTDPEAEPVGGD